jgi:hypothetical protein
MELWLCRCDCGKELPVIKYQIASGSKESCGCLHRERMTEVNKKSAQRTGIPNDLVGMVFGRLTVLQFDHFNQRRASYWLCRCECEVVKAIAKFCLLRGDTRSCGCLQSEQARQRRLKHGMAEQDEHGWIHRTYRIWSAMRTRCNNPNATGYKNYGGRGVRVCPEWDDFSVFLRDMGECPPEKSIDRYPDKNGNYEKSNCRYATPREQRLNQRARTHCPQGHLYAGDIDYRGRQVCIPCRKAHLQRRKQRKLEAINGCV